MPLIIYRCFCPHVKNQKLPPNTMTSLRHAGHPWKSRWKPYLKMSNVWIDQGFLEIPGIDGSLKWKPIGNYYSIELFIWLFVKFNQLNCSHYASFGCWGSMPIYGNTTTRQTTPHRRCCAEGDIVDGQHETSPSHAPSITVVLDLFTAVDWTICKHISSDRRWKPSFLYCRSTLYDFDARIEATSELYCVAKRTAEQP